jgi:hypothetical protein
VDQDVQNEERLQSSANDKRRNQISLSYPWRKPRSPHGDGRGNLQLWNHPVQRCARIVGCTMFPLINPGWSWPEVRTREWKRQMGLHHFIDSINSLSEPYIGTSGERKTILEFLNGNCSWYRY